MGYTTDFEGVFKLNKRLSAEHRAYLKMFAETRRMKRDAEKTKLRPDPVREAVGLPVGREGTYFVGETGGFGQGRGPDILDHNKAAGSGGWDFDGPSPRRVAGAHGAHL